MRSDLSSPTSNRRTFSVHRGCALALGIAWALSVMPVAALAQSALYAVDGAGTGGGGGPSTLYFLDAQTGAVIQEIGPTGFNEVSGISFDPVTGVLYGVANGTDELITIDIVTGAGTAVGPVGAGWKVPDLSFAPSGILYGWTENSDELITIDLTSGSATLVPGCAIGTSRTGLAVDLAGNAFMKASGALYSVDRNTGVCTLATSLTPAATYHNVLAFDDKGTLYTARRNGATTDLYTVDTVTGVVALVGSNSIGTLSSLAFQPPPLEPLYAVDGAGGNPSSLYRLDPRDGSVIETIGAVGFNHVTGLSFHPVTGALYGTSSVGSAGTGELLTIDVNTGAGAAIGLHGLSTPDLDFAPSGVLYGWTEGGDDLITLDLATGAGAVVGACGLGTFQSGLAIDRAGDAFVKAGAVIYSVDRVTGLCTAGPTIAGISPKNVLAINNRGTAYTLVRGITTDLYTVDLQTAATRFVGSNAIANLAGLAFQPHPLPPLYATDGAGGNPSTLYRLDPRDGSIIATIGPIGFSDVTGLSFHPVTGVLYGATSDSNGSGSAELLTIDTTTGVGTAVGAHGTRTSDLSFAPSGTLYNWRPDNLATFDLTTATSTLVGPCGIGGGQNGIAVDHLGRVFLKQSTNVRTVDRLTGACSALSSLVVPLSLRNALTFSPQGTAYTLERIAGLGADLYVADLQTGSTTNLGGNTIANLAALAFKPPRPTNLYATDGASGNRTSLYLIDPDDASVVANLGPLGFDHVTGISFDPITGALYGTSSTNGVGSGELLLIDAETAAASAVGLHGMSTPDLSFSPSGILYGWNETGGLDELVTLDLTTGIGAGVGASGLGTGRTGLAIDRSGSAFVKRSDSIHPIDRATGAAGPLLSTLSVAGAHNVLTFDESDTAYTARRVAGGAEIYTADLGTGSMTLVGSNGLEKLAALAFRPAPLPPFYATDGASGNPSTLYRLDPRDGSVLQTIGAIGFDHVTGLAYDPPNDILYGVTAGINLPGGSGELLSIDRSTGVGTPIGLHNELSGMPDLTFKRTGATLFGWTENGDDLVSFDVGTGDATVVGNCGSGSAGTGLAADPFGNLFMKSNSAVFSVNDGTGACTAAATLAPVGALRNLLEISPRGTAMSAERNATADIYTADFETGGVRLVGSNPITKLAAFTFAGGDACAFAGGDIDGDGICDDVDNCPPGVNWPDGVANPSQADGDGDGRGDSCDNCLAIANGPTAFAPGLASASQCDKDSDGYGNACDGDFDQNGFVTPLDNGPFLAALAAFFPPPPGQHDMDCNGFMTPLDNSWYLSQLMGFFPGPSGWSCKGVVTGACPPLP